MNDDPISRQAMIKEIERANGALYWNETLMENLVSVAKAIPTIDPVKHGKWVLPRDEGCVTYDKHAYAECSMCGKKSFLGWSDEYCRNCGARMDLDDYVECNDFVLPNDIFDRKVA